MIWKCDVRGLFRTLSNIYELTAYLWAIDSQLSFEKHFTNIGGKTKANLGVLPRVARIGEIGYTFMT